MHIATFQESGNLHIPRKLQKDLGMKKGDRFFINAGSDGVLKLTKIDEKEQ